MLLLRHPDLHTAKLCQWLLPYRRLIYASSTSSSYLFELMKNKVFHTRFDKSVPFEKFQTSKFAHNQKAQTLTHKYAPILTEISQRIR